MAMPELPPAPRPQAGATGAEPSPPRADAFRFWLWLGCVSFGGPAGQIAIMHRELVERRRWISEERFLGALNFCMLLPGPEAQQLATYIGWRLHGLRGGLVAGLLFVLPSAVLLLGLSWLYAAHGHLATVAALLTGFRSAVLAILAIALLRLGRRALVGALQIGIAVAAFCALRFVDLPLPLIVVVAGLASWLALPAASKPPESVEPDRSAPAKPWRSTTAVHAIGVLSAGLALWVGGAAALVLGNHWHSLHGELYRFFSQAALTTLGGAYSILAYVADTASLERGWLTAAQTMDGLALAETTPGPLIIVLQFIGYMAGWNHPGTMTPAASGALGAVIASFATFLPSFVFVLLGAPHIERLQRVRRLQAALAGVSAAVVGGIVHLAVTFGAATLFLQNRPSWATLEAGSLVLAVIAFVLLARTRLAIAWVVIGCGAAGLLLRL